MLFKCLSFSLFLLLLVLYFPQVLAQTPETEMIVEELMEEINQDEEEDVDFTEVTERLDYYLEDPIDLNKTDGRELRDLKFLSPLQVEALLSHRQVNGDFLSLYELQSVSGFDERSIQRLLPFVRVRENGQQGIKIREGKHDLIFRYGKIMEKQKGYLKPEKPSQSHYAGPADRLFVRYRYRLQNKLQLSLNMKKDAGEEFFGNNQRYGFDFYSANVFVRDLGKVSSLAVGDYSLQLGQGLTMWSGLSFGKGSLVQNVARQGSGLRPYTSANESQFLRGIAGTVSLGKIEILPFISYKKVDATLSGDSSFFSSLALSGYHRTQSEIKNQNSIAQLMYGLNLLYATGNLKIGAVALQTSFDKPMVPNNQLYNRHAFQGDELTNTSIYYHYTLRNVYLFGEGAYSSNQGLGMVNGLIGSLSRQLSLVVLHRHYEKNFYSFMNQGFAENSRASNERGLYTGLLWNPNRRVQLVVYADYFRFPWLRYRVDGPSEGHDLFSQLTYTPKKTVNAVLRYRYRNKQENLVLDGPVNKLENVVRHQVRLEAKYKISEVFQFRNRMELATYSKGPHDNEYGYMLYHDFIIKPPQKSLSGNLRIAAFKTDGYNSRIYAFENDVLYGYSFPPYYNTGLRLYGNLRYRIRRNLDFWIRYASFIYSEKGIGSGLDRIEGNIKSDLRLQVRFQF